MQPNITAAAMASEVCYAFLQPHLLKFEMISVVQNTFACERRKSNNQEVQQFIYREPACGIQTWKTSENHFHMFAK